jgi:hypothetical protein
MVIDLYPAVYAPAGLGACLSQVSEQDLPILFIPGNRFPAIASGHDMVKRPEILNTNLPWHHLQ